MTSRWTGFRSPLAVGIEMFLAHKQALGYHLRTTESVLRLLDRFLVEQQVETNEAITPAVIDAFLASRPRTAPRSFNQLLGIVTRLFEWLIARDLVPRSPVQAKPRRTTASRLPFLFDRPTARRLLDAAGALPDTRNTPRRGLTYRTIFALLYGLGLRVGEVARLRMRDVDLRRQLLVVRETKFAKSRLVPFGPRIGRLVADYLDLRMATPRTGPWTADLPIFSFRKRQPVSPGTISSCPSSRCPSPTGPDLPVFTASATRLPWAPCYGGTAMAPIRGRGCCSSRRSWVTSIPGRPPSI
jgi:site-specific recombinase XerD